jgi:hypothetical protein
MQIKRVASLRETNGGSTLDIREMEPERFQLTIVRRGDRLIYGSFASVEVAEEHGLKLAARHGMKVIHIVHTRATH